MYTNRDYVGKQLLKYNYYSTAKRLKIYFCYVDWRKRFVFGKNELREDLHITSLRTESWIAQRTAMLWYLRLRLLWYSNETSITYIDNDGICWKTSRKYEYRSFHTTILMRTMSMSIWQNLFFYSPELFPYNFRPVKWFLAISNMPFESRVPSNAKNDS